MQVGCEYEAGGNASLCLNKQCQHTPGHPKAWHGLYVERKGLSPQPVASRHPLAATVTQPDPPSHLYAPPDFKWGSNTWRLHTWQKVAVVRAVNHLNFHVVHSDIDVIWRRDPFPYFREKYTIPGGHVGRR